MMYVTANATAVFHPMAHSRGETLWTRVDLAFPASVNLMVLSELLESGAKHYVWRTTMLMPTSIGELIGDSRRRLLSVVLLRLRDVAGLGVHPTTEPVKSIWRCKRPEKRRPTPWIVETVDGDLVTDDLEAQPETLIREACIYMRAASAANFQEDGGDPPHDPASTGDGHEQ